MSHRLNSATAEILRLFKGPKELHAPPAGKVGERALLAYDVALHRMVARGLKASDLEGISRIIGATAGTAAEVRRAIVPDSTWKRRKGKTLSPSESDQTARLARVTALALDTWRGNLDAVREFLATPHPELDGERPVHAMQTDSGARLVEDILNRLRHGLPA
jgi:putative toxin-antitoxin system antitoxin component (TIGR02293 family)